jgi:hypothetical protein
MKVRAKKFGFHLQKRRVGEVFDFEGIPSGIWMEPVDEAARAAFKKAGLKVPEPAKAPREEKEEPGKGKGSKGKTLSEAAAEEGFVRSSGDQDVI